MSICPKNKSSKGRRDKRRANWKMTAPALVKCSKCGELMMPHRVCKNCGSYNKKPERTQTDHINDLPQSLKKLVVNIKKIAHIYSLL
jgi:large subunit ribosomal protein L32